MCVFKLFVKNIPDAFSNFNLSNKPITVAKIKDEKGGYNKSNFLTWNSSISYNTLKESMKLSEITSNVRVKSLSGSELFRVRMHHNLYKLALPFHKLHSEYHSQFSIYHHF